MLHVRQDPLASKQDDQTERQESFRRDVTPKRLNFYPGITLKGCIYCQLAQYKPFKYTASESVRSRPLPRSTVLQPTPSSMARSHPLLRYLLHCSVHERSALKLISQNGLGLTTPKQKLEFCRDRRFEFCQ